MLISSTKNKFFKKDFRRNSKKLLTFSVMLLYNVYSEGCIHLILSCLIIEIDCGLHLILIVSDPERVKT